MMLNMTLSVYIYAFGDVVSVLRRKYSMIATYLDRVKQRLTNYFGSYASGHVNAGHVGM